MSGKELSHWIIASTINLLVIIFLIRTAWNGNDKAIILVIVYYPVLTLLNLVIWLVLRLQGKRDSEIYKTLAICLLILYIPVLFIASAY